MEDNVLIGLGFIVVGIIGFIVGFTTQVDPDKEKEFLEKKEKSLFEKINYVPPSAHRVREFVLGILGTTIGILHLLNIL